MARDIYENIKSYADESDKSIRQIEMALGYSNGTIRKWRNNAPIPKLTEVAGYLGVSINQLIYAKQKEV